MKRHHFHRALMLAITGLLAATLTNAAGHAAWEPHRVKRGDGQGGEVLLPAKRQVLTIAGATQLMPFGIVQMDNGEVGLIASREIAKPSGREITPVIFFSRDGGENWSEPLEIEGTSGRPMNLAFLGDGNLTFLTDKRYFSHDYGRTWPESIDHPPTTDGLPFHLEGNVWVDRDEDGNAVKLMEIGWHYKPGKRHPVDDATCVFRYSTDGGRTWQGEVQPPNWKFTLPYKGEPYLRGVSEGAIVRAENGWLVAALRSDMPPHFFDGPHDDSLEGTAISISKDEGQTWSDLDILYKAGRHHANLQRLPNGDLVCVMVRRVDIKDGELNSPMRGCDALVSHDNGLTWNLGGRYTLDEFEYLDPGYWVNGQCGHIGSAVLDDGSVLSVYGKYHTAEAVLIKWRPDAEPVGP